MEVALGIHRIESDLGPRFMCQYALVGDERVLLVDTGLASTPEEVIAPYLERLGVEPQVVLISHADVDHCGGNRAIRRRYSGALLMCHELDRRWIESNAALLEENYLWHEPHGFDEPDEETRQQILADCGGGTPVDVGLRGGETLLLSEGRRVEILHLPGHTLGHLGVWDDRSRAAIIVDAVLHEGIYDRAGNKLIPPRYYDARAQQETIRRLLALEPDLLLTAHYPVMERDGARAWLREALAFTEQLEAVVREGVAAGTTDLWELTKLANERLGPYPEWTTELGASVRAHATA
jgi:glyoxylase-like metal-dependent hydrolase (beta-lactamase superfamily II)